jgi:hypothetical protein
MKETKTTAEVPMLGGQVPIKPVETERMVTPEVAALETPEQKKERELAKIQEKGRQQRISQKTTEVKQQAGARKKLSALAKSKIFATEGFGNLVAELKRGEKAVPKSFAKRFTTWVDAMTAGNFSEMLEQLPFVKEGDLSNDEATLFQSQRESLAVAVYKFVSGDVGNIAASESKRALKLIPGVLDTPSLRKVKIAALERATARAKSALDTLINSDEAVNMTPEELEQAQRTIANQALMEAAASIPAGDVEQGSGVTFGTVEEAEAAGLPPGTEIMIGGRRAIVE